LQKVKSAAKWGKKGKGKLKYFVDSDMKRMYVFIDALLIKTGLLK